jgi:hypothetical protein
MTEPAIGLDPDSALKQIFRDPSWKIVLGTGSVINAAALVLLGTGSWALPLLPVAFLLWAAVQGYMLKVVRTSIADPASGLPEWSNWPDLLISGLTWMAFICLQVIVALSVFYFSLVIGAMRGFLNSLTPQFPMWAYGTIAANSLVLFIATFFLPLLMANFAENERVAAALAVPVAMKRLLKAPEQFLLFWLLSLGIYAVAVVVPLFTLVGIMFIPLTTFVASLMNAIMLAQVWRSTK